MNDNYEILPAENHPLYDHMTRLLGSCKLNYIANTCVFDKKFGQYAVAVYYRNSEVGVVYASEEDRTDPEAMVTVYDVNPDNDFDMAAIEQLKRSVELL